MRKNEIRGELNIYILKSAQSISIQLPFFLCSTATKLKSQRVPTRHMKCAVAVRRLMSEAGLKEIGGRGNRIDEGRDRRRPRDVHVL